jgi:AraC-like DNA-binding protein
MLPQIGMYQMEIYSKYRNVFNYIINNCSFRLNIDSIAANINKPSYLLKREFSRDMGFSLKTYIDKIILKKAQDSLLIDDMNVKEISNALDFTDEFYFSRFFKKHTGLSPTMYHRKNKINN